MSRPDLSQPATLSAHLTAFGRRLRGEGLLVGPAEIALGLDALGAIDLGDRDEVRGALACVFATSPLERRRFDHLFDAYWQGRAELDAEAPASNVQLPAPTRPMAPRVRDWAQRPEADEELTTMGYSRQEVRAAQDFARLEGDDLDEVKRLVARLAKRLATRLSRREIASTRRSTRADLRRTLRRSLGTGGEPFRLAFRRRRKGRTRLVFLFDVSGSMMVYSQFLLELAYAFVQQRALGRSEVFGFSTDLYRLTEVLRHLGPGDAIVAARRAMPGRSGGTRIGASLHRYLERWGGTLDDRTVVIVASDGWDTGDLELLERSLRSLKRRSARLIWLNPLAGHAGYRPTAAGMRTALPFVDVFAPAHNLASLRALERILPET